ncbi:MAG TPA: hypothetical protein VIH90_06945, partial [Candidatus Saccharimonadales bacterium]
TINNNDTADSLAANTIITGTGSALSIPAGSSISLVYDSGASVWRVEGGAANTVTYTAANNTLSNLATTSINQSLVANANNTLNLGSSSNAWATLYAGTSVLTPGVDTITAGTLSLGTTTATAITIGRTGVTTTINGPLNLTVIGSAANNTNLCSNAGVITSCSNSYVQSNPSGVQTANINLQSAAIGTIGQIIRGATGQTADLLDLENTGGTAVIAGFNASGNLTLGNSSTAGKLYLTDGADVYNLLINVATLPGSSSVQFPYSPTTNDQICLFSLANCAHSGGGITGAGTNHQIAVFTGTNTLGTGSIYDDGAGHVIVGDATASSSLFAVGTANQLTVSSAGALTTSGAIQGLSFDANSASGLNVGTGLATGITLGKAGVNTAVAGELTVANIDNLGTTQSLQIGNTTGAVAQSISIGNNTTSSSTSTVIVGSLLGSSALTLQAGSSNLALSTGSTTGNITLTTNNSTSKIIAQSSVNSTTAFQVQNTGGNAVLNVDTANGQATITSANSGATGSVVVNTSGSAFAGFGSGTVNSFTGWTSTGWTSVSANNATNGSGNTSGLISNWSPASSSTYLVSYTISGCSTTNTVGVTMGGVTLQNPSDCSSASPFSNSVMVTASNTNPLTFTPSSTYVGSITNVYIDLINQSTAALVVNNSGSAATLQVRSAVDNTSAFVGLNSGQSNNSGSDDSGFGTNSLQSNVSGSINSASGYESLQSNSSGSNNTANGGLALQYNTTGSNNTAVGEAAAQATTVGSYNVGVGAAALEANIVGSNNTALGYSAGYIDSNSFVTPANLQNATAIGAFSQVQASNTLVLGSVTPATQVSIGSTIAYANSALSVSPLAYSTGTACSASSSVSTTCIGSGTSTFVYSPTATWTSSFVGDMFIFKDGQTATITAVNSSKNLTLSSSLAEYAAVNYRIQSIGLQVVGSAGANSGYVGVGVAVPTSLFSVGSNFGVNGTGNVTFTPVSAATSPTYACISSNQLASCSTTGTGSAFVQGGNSFGGTAILGTADANNLQLNTAGTNRAVLDQSGNLTFQQATTIATTSGNSISVTSGTNGQASFDSGTTGLVSIGTNANSKTIQIGNTTSAVTNTIGVGNNSTAGATVNLTVGSIIAGTTTIQNATTINLNAPAVASNATGLTLFATPTTVAAFAGTTSLSLGGNTVGNVINLGTGNIASGTEQVNIATSASSTGKTAVTIGSTFGASSVVVQGGTGYIALSPTGSANVGVGTASPSYLFSVGNNYGVNSTGNVTFAPVSATVSPTYACISSNQLASCSTTGTGSAFVQGGNSFGATATLGTADANNLQFNTNNINRLVLDQSGNFTFQQATTIATTSGNNLTVNSGTTGSATFDSGSTGQVNIGTNANSKTIQIGNTTAAVTDNIGVGNNGFAGSTSNVTLGSTVAGTTTIQNAATINLNASAVASNATNLTLFATPTTVAEYAAATSLTIGGATGTNTVNIANGNVASGTGAVNIATNASSTGKTTTTIGSTFGASSVVVQGGTGNITLNPSGTSNSGVVIKPTAANSTAAFLIQNTSGYNALSFDTTTGTLKVWDSASSPTNYAYISYSSNTAVFAASSGVTQLGATSGNVSIPLTGATDHFTFTHTYTPAAAYSTNDYTIERILTGGSQTLTGNVLDVEDRSTGTADAATVMYLNENNASATGYVIQAQSAATTNLLTLDNSGNLNVASGYQVNGTAGVTATCASGQSLVASVFSGGIATGGSCSGSTGTLQNDYNNSSSPATITTSSSSKGILFKAGSGNDSTALLKVENAATTSLLNVDSSDGSGLVQIGTTAGTNEVVLGLSQYSTFADSGTCNTAGDPNGALYFNTSSNAVRGCVNGSWQDLPSTADLGILLFGVIPTSGTSVGDLASITTTGPCKVTYTSVTTVTVQPCTAYSGGRKVTVPSTLVTISGMTTTNIWVHLCLNAANTNQPALTTASSSETANEPTFSASAPILCLADIKGSASTANNIAQIYDTRTFTTTQKDYVDLSTAAGLGWLVVANGSQGTPATTSVAATVEGAIVATDGSTSSTTPNAIIAIGGPTYVKAISGSAGDFVQSTTTTGYASAGSTTGAFGSMGISRNTYNASCSSSTTCIGSLYFNETLSY